jgi:hypothetical protein
VPLNTNYVGMSLEEQRQLQLRDGRLQEVRSIDSALAENLPDLDSLGRVLEHLDRTSNEEVLAQESQETRRLWHDVGLFYIYSGRIHDAIAVFHRLYERLCGYQRECKTWVPKGLPLVRIAECHELLAHPAIGAWYLLLTAVSDAIRDKGSLDPKGGVYPRALQRGWDAGKLEAFYADCLNAYHPDDPLCGFPEHVLSKVDIPFSTPYVATSELDIYQINKVYAATILAALNDSSGDKTGKALERLAGYFLGRIPGFDARPGFQSGDAQYDGFVRNTGPKYDFRADLGFYLLVECKDWKKPVGVPQVSQFINKLVLQDCRSGILFSSQGITGEGDTRDAELQLLKAHYRAGKVIFVLNEDDFKQVANGTSLILMLRKKYEEVRFDIPHRQSC